MDAKCRLQRTLSYLIHKYRHHAEDVIAVRRWGNVFGRGMAGWGAIGTNWALSSEAKNSSKLSLFMAGGLAELLEKHDFGDEARARALEWAAAG